MNRTWVFLVLVAVAWGSAGAFTNPLESGLIHCAKEADRAARLACFDALVATIPTVKADQFGLTADIARKRQTAAAAAAGPAAAESAAAAGPAAAALSGTEPAGAGPAASAATATIAAEPAAAETVALPGKIVALSLAPRGEIIFTLDNAQVWMQTQVEPGKQFSLGDAVRIEHGAMGSYWLTADKARKTKVKRVS